MIRTLELLVTRQNSYTKSGYQRDLEDVTVFFNETTDSVDEYVQDYLIRKFEVLDEDLIDGYTVSFLFAEFSDVNNYHLFFRDIQISTHRMMTDICGELNLDAGQVSKAHIDDWLSTKVSQWKNYVCSKAGEYSVISITNSFSLTNYIELFHQGNQSDFARNVETNLSDVSEAIRESCFFFNGKIYRVAPRITEFGLEEPEDRYQFS
jgi:hypothetical protein